MSASIPTNPGRLSYQQTYVFSGKISPVAIVATIVGAGLAALILSAAYAYADLYIPIIYANILLTIGFGGAVGWITARLMRQFNARSPRATVALAMAIMLGAYYACWAFWVFAVLQRFGTEPITFSPLDLAKHPAVMWDIVQRINTFGTWSFGHTGGASDAVTGGFLWFCWLAEAAGIFGASFGAARATAMSRLYCEKCNVWTQTPTTLALTAPIADGDLTKRLQSGDFDFVPSLPRWNGLPGTYLKWTIQKCDKCTELNGLSVTAATTTRTKKKSKTKERKIIKNLLVDTSAVARMTAKPTPPAAIPAAPVAAPAVAAAPVAAAPVPQSAPLPPAPARQAPPPNSDNLLDL